MSLSLVVPLILYRLHYLNLVSTLSGTNMHRWCRVYFRSCACLGNQIPVFLDDSKKKFLPKLSSTPPPSCPGPQL
ncbi:hypothetical protein EDB89DRAFT_1982280 [Lactarius sanguifluus]|nr:hypothetical protein EDB89DRAFT_1982280 [Lactarius sanguifluus]